MTIVNYLRRKKLELVLLSVSLPAFGWDAAEGTLEARAWGPYPEKAFDFVDKVLLSATSLEQVHRARLRTSKAVFVKIQRPGLEQLLDLDLEALGVVVEYILRSEKFGGETRDWVAIYEECKKTPYLDIFSILRVAMQRGLPLI